MTPRGAARRRWRSGRGALWLIAGLLAASGALRLAIDTGPAIAREVESLRETALAAAPDEGCTPAPEIATVLEALGDREDRLSKREQALEDRLAALEMAEEMLARNMAALEAAEARLAETLTLADDASEKDLARLTSVYENMKPKEAAALFEEMAPKFAAGFLGRMRPDAAAAVMAGLQPETAYAISVMLAGRNAEVPRD